MSKDSVHDLREANYSYSQTDALPPSRCGGGDARRYIGVHWYEYYRMYYCYFLVSASSFRFLTGRMLLHTHTHNVDNEKHKSDPQKMVLVVVVVVVAILKYKLFYEAR